MKRLYSVLVVLIILSILILVIKSSTNQIPQIPQTSEQIFEPLKKFIVKKLDEPAIISEEIKTLPQIIESIESSIELENSERTLSIISTGDVMLGRTVNYKTLSYKDFTWSFKNIAELTKTGDIAFINLENPFIKNCPTKNEGMIFCAPNDHVNGLIFAGIDAASMANNHSYNYGKDGLTNTEEVLNQNSILVVGKNNPIYKEIKGLKIALLGYNDVECYPKSIACLDEEKVISETKTARENADLVVIMFHWGTEYTHQPTQRQKDFAHIAINNGADLILGNHPHWYQPLEMYKEKLILYSHGNTIFDQMWSEKTKEGLILKTTFDVKTKKLIDVKIYPTYIQGYGQPKFLESEKKQEILHHLKEISSNLK